MQFFWVTDQVLDKEFDVQWHPGKENLADYFTKHFDTAHHQNMCPWYVHEQNSPRELPRATAPKAIQGYVGTQEGGYIKDGPLPKIYPIRRVTPPSNALARLGRAVTVSTWQQTVRKYARQLIQAAG